MNQMNKELDENLQDLIESIADTLPERLVKSADWQAFKYLLQDFQEENKKIIEKYIK